MADADKLNPSLYIPLSLPGQCLERPSLSVKLKAHPQKSYREGIKNSRSTIPAQEWRQALQHFRN
jgi:hypothetical protein